MPYQYNTYIILTNLPHVCRKDYLIFFWCSEPTHASERRKPQESKLSSRLAQAREGWSNKQGQLLRNLFSTRLQVYQFWVLGIYFIWSTCLHWGNVFFNQCCFKNLNSKKCASHEFSNRVVFGATASSSQVNDLDRNKKLILRKDAEFNDASKEHYTYKNKRWGFRCNYHYADGSCYGGPDGGTCPSGRRRRSAPPKVKMKMNNKLQRGLSLADDGKCGPRWMEITSQEKCEEAANSLGLKFKLQRDNTRAITGCIATEVFEERGNRTSA